MSNTSAGFYGKIPMTGDFIHRRVNPVFLNRWDEWLKRNINQSQHTLGDNWLGVYLTSPMWRFMLSPGIIDDKAYAGVMIPSVDSVGRYFPLTLVQALPQQAASFILSDAADNWFAQLEDVLMDMLEGFHGDANAFDEALQQCQSDWMQDLGGNKQINLQQLAQAGNHLKIDVQDGQSFNQSMTSLLFSSLLNSKTDFSLWWQHSADNLDSSCLFSTGLPAEQQFTALFDGSWQEHGWQPLNLAGPAKPVAAKQAAPSHNASESQPQAAPQKQQATANADVTSIMETAAVSETGMIDSSDAIHSLEDLLDATQPGYQTRKTPAASGPASIDEDEQDDRDITWTPLLDEEKSDSTAPNYNRSDSHSYGFTDAGNCREHNEDAMLLNPSAGLWVVADGMGGHHDGAHASQAVVEALARVDLAGSMEQILERIKIALDQVNQELLDFANNQSESGICGSTVVGMIIRDNQCAFFWAGDSRLYLYRHNQLHQLSKDHSLEQEQIDQGIISANDENFSGKNLITRAVGGDDILAVDFCYHNLQVGDQFMLCSDGVYGELTHITMQQIMAQSESLEAAGTRFQNRISAGLAKDNFTGILVRF